MAPQLGGQGVGLATVLAGEGALPAVQDPVLLQVALRALRLVALGALERPHAPVGQQVGFEALLRAAALATLRAEEGFVASVDETMLLEVAELQEGFATLPTPVPAPGQPLVGQDTWWGGRAASMTPHQLHAVLLLSRLLH